MRSSSIVASIGFSFCLAACGAPATNEPNPAAEETSPETVLPKTRAGEPSCKRGWMPQFSEVWRRSLVHGVDVLDGASLATDIAGNVFVAREGQTFKLGPRGGMSWSKPFGSMVATDATGNAVVAGTFSGTLSLGDRSLTAVGGTDVYVAGLDGDGVPSYAVGLGLGGDESLSSLAVDGKGNAIVSGPGLGTQKLDPAGNLVWQRDFTGVIAVDPEGNVVATGKNVFVAKLTADGDLVFNHEYGAGALQYGEAIAVDAAGQILVSGVFDGSLDFGGGPLSVAGDACPAEAWCKQAGFVVKLDPTGSHIWSKSRTPVRSITGLAFDSRGHVLASGAYPGNASPYRTVLILELDPDGNEVPLWEGLDSSLLAAGAGHGIAANARDNLFWSLAISSEHGANASATSLLVKLAPSCSGA
jgi:hypothetical protein